MNDIGTSAVIPSENPICFLHCAIFLADTSLINTAKIKKYVDQKALGNTDLTLLNSGIVSDDVFRVQSIQGQEQISNPYNFDLVLHGNTDMPGGPVKIDFDQFIGRPVTIGINLPSKEFNDDYDLASGRFIDAILGNDKGTVSLFNGIVSSFSMKQPGVYSLSVKPSLWKLTLTNQYAIFYKKNIKELIAEVLDRHNIAYNMDAISGDDNIAISRTQDWLQAGETDYELIQRVMGAAHIYYFFNHTATTHEVVFANRPAYPKVFEDGRSLRYAYSEEADFNQDDIIKEYDYKKTLMSSAVSSVFTTMENAWQACPNISYHTFEANSEKQVGDLPFQLYRIYQYGGSVGETSEYTKQTGDTLNTAKSAFSGSSTYANLRAGYKFSVTNADAKLEGDYPVRPSLNNEWFVLTQVQHNASGDGGYQNQFQATESSGLITQFNMHETRQGSVLAEVVDHGGSDALTGNPWYGAKADFDPVQSTLTDTQASSPPKTMNTEGVYVKLSSDGENAKPHWVKLAPHMQQAPEIGAIVFIARSSDDSEIPEIQNVIQNNGNKTVTCGGWTTNTQVGNNYSTSYGDSKSVRYGLKSSVDLDTAVNIVEENYATGLYKDCSYSKGGSYSYSTADKGKPGLLSRSKSFGSTYSDHTGAKSISYAEIDYSYNNSKMINTDSYSTISEKSYSESTIGETESITTIKGESKSTSTIGSSVSTNTINTNSTSTSTILGNSFSTNTVEGINSSITTLNIATSLSTTAAQAGVSTTGVSANINTVGAQAGFSLTGMSANASITGLSSTISVVGFSDSDSVVGTSLSTNLIGSSISASITGSNASSSTVGISANESLTGVSASTSLTGVSDNTSLTGSSVNTSLTGSTLNTNITGSSTSTSITGISDDISISGSVNSLSVKGETIMLDVSGASLKLTEDGATLDARIVGTMTELVSAIKVIL